MAAREKPLRHQWRDLVKSTAGPDDHVLRWVLIVLGDWSPLDGGPFSVSVAMLCEQTALCDSAVRERLAQAKGVWITEQLRPGKTTIYRLRIPTAIDAIRPLEEIRGRARSSAGWESEGSGDPTASAVDPESETLPPARRTPTASAGDHPTARAAARRKETSPAVARAREAMPEGPRSPALDEEPAAAIGPGGLTRYRTRTRLQELGVAIEEIPASEDAAQTLLAKRSAATMTGGTS